MLNCSKQSYSFNFNILFRSCQSKKPTIIQILSLIISNNIISQILFVISFIFQQQFSHTFILQSQSQQMNEDVVITASDLICFICQDYFCRPYTACCGHSFCQLCLEEYLLIAEICPMCSQKIREKYVNPVPSLGEFVQNFMKNDKTESANLSMRKQQLRQHLKNKELKNIKVGMKLDIRDSNYIWCEGMVIRIISKLGQNVKYLRISYLNYMDKKEEDVKINSDRLASSGFYTKRKDIPNYDQKKVNQVIQKYQN